MTPRICTLCLASWLIVVGALVAAEPAAIETIAELETRLVAVDFAADVKYVQELAERAGKSRTLSPLAAKHLNDALRLRYDRLQDNEDYDRIRFLQLAYAEALGASLPQKQDAAQAQSAFTVFQLYCTDIPHRWLDKSRFAAVRVQARRSFGLLPQAEQYEFLCRYWQRLGDKSQVPAIRRLVEQAAEADPKLEEYEQEYALPDMALKRLFQVDPQQAKEVIIAEIRRDRPRVARSTLKILPDEPIPALDDTLISRLQPAIDRFQREFENYQDAERAVNDAERLAELVNRYGSPALLQRVEQALEKELANGSTTGCAALVSFILKHNPQRGVALANKLLGVPHENELDRELLGKLAQERLSPELEQLARARLDDPRSEVASSAVSIVGEFPTDANRQLLKNRLRRWHAEQVRIKTQQGKFDPDLKYHALDNGILVALCENRQRIIAPSEVHELEPFCVTDQARDHARYCGMAWEVPLRIRFYPVPDSEFESRGWTEGANGPPSNTDLWYVAQYPAASQAELKALLARFPRGTTFSLPEVSSDANEFAKFFNELRQHVEQHGMKLVKAER